MLKDFDRMIHSYMEYRENLHCAFVLIDANVPPQKRDLEFINYLGEHQVPFVIVYTKIDRLRKNKVQDHVAAVQNTLLETWNELPQQFFTSANTGEGRDEILSFIEQVNQQVKSA
jgi:GTP-binding protein